MSTAPIKKHGILRGLDSVNSSMSFEGRFGRMFRTLPKANFTDNDLILLADKMSAKKEDNPTPETESDDEENSGISAGYTYLGQFIDHDLTFDPESSLQKQNDPDGLTDFRTPRFDLDNLYGRGSDDQPYLYENDGKKFILGRPLTGSDLDTHVRDVQRNSPSSGDRRAIIGDPRNDENVIVSQLQAIFLRFHNAMVNQFSDGDYPFLQRLVRWHYQWVILYDFLPTIIGKDMLNQILPHIQKNTNVLKDPPVLKFYKWRDEPFIPVEFSVAAYRFGHSMVRPLYRLNQKIERLPIFSVDPNNSLTSFREFNPGWAIDWRLYFDFGNNPSPASSQRIQPAYKIDSSLVNPLANLPPTIAVNPPNLALRNLKRGVSLGLPSGQAVARKMGIPVIPDELLKVGKTNEADFKTNPTLVSLSANFRDNAPLWFYILAEAQQQFKDNSTPIRLGPVGGRIVGEVFVGLLLGDKNSFLSQDPDFQPSAFFKKAGKFGIAELISAAIK
ncbi:MAG: heme peroxidase family protein [Chitinophagaceae bacterium]